MTGKFAWSRFELQIPIPPPGEAQLRGGMDEPRQAGVCAADAASSVDHLPPLRDPLSGHVQSEVFSCLDQCLRMAFAQLNFQESLRDIEVCLRAQSSKLYHLGIRRAVRYLNLDAHLSFFFPSTAISFHTALALGSKCGASRIIFRAYRDNGRSCKMRSVASTRTSRWKSSGKMESAKRLQIDIRIMPW